MVTPNHSSMTQSSLVLTEEDFDQYFSHATHGVNFLKGDDNIPKIREISLKRMKRYPIYHNNPRIRESLKGYGHNRGHLTHVVVTISASAETPHGEPLNYNENVIIVRGANNA